MKRTSILLALALSACLAACGSSTASTETAAEPAAAQSTEQAAPEVSAEQAVPAAESTVSLPEFNTRNASLDETVLYDDGSYKVTATGLTIEENGRTAISFLFENATSEDIRFDLKNGIILNGVMVPTRDFVDVSANSSNTYEYTSSKRTLMGIGINELGSIQTAVKVESPASRTVFVDTLSETAYTSASDSIGNAFDIVEEEMASGQWEAITENRVLFWQAGEVYGEYEGVQVTGAGIVRNSDDETQLLVEVENTTSESFPLVFDNLCLNGLGMLYISSHDVIPANAKALLTCEIQYGWESSFFSTLGLDEIRSAAFSMFPHESGTASFEGEKAKVELGEASAYSCTGTPIFEKDGYTVYFAGIAEETKEDPERAEHYFILVGENNSSDDIVMYYFPSATVNSVDMDLRGSSSDTFELAPGETGVYCFSLADRDLQAANLTLDDIETITLNEYHYYNNTTGASEEGSSTFSVK